MCVTWQIHLDVRDLSLPLSLSESWLALSSLSTVATKLLDHLIAPGQGTAGHLVLPQNRSQPRQQLKLHHCLLHLHCQVRQLIFWHRKPVVEVQASSCCVSTVTGSDHLLKTVLVPSAVVEKVLQRASSHPSANPSLQRAVTQLWKGSHDQYLRFMRTKDPRGPVRPQHKSKTPITTAC